MKTFSFILSLFLFSLLFSRLDAAAVGKGAVGSGGRGRGGMKQKSGGGRKSGGGPILISKDNRAGGKESLLESSAGDAYYNNPNGASIKYASHFESEYILGRKLSFYCKAQGLPRPRITWLKDGIELYEHPFFQVHEFNVGKDQITSKMEIDPTTQRDSGYYECQADNKYAVDKRGFRTDYTLDVY
ncbi:immunoglobulin domain-containing protein oig-4-like [Daphnia carinata]|uniref:immunoglobulin domain-containing protein oig-4-like n=1 Tax=Daphnia carinata TaxID=120202 RepID=UPI0025801D9A|nr:immunoglobulin domain-containing protein oig-4-like [Daphnia carinata]